MSGCCSLAGGMKNLLLARAEPGPERVGQVRRLRVREGEYRHCQAEELNCGPRKPGSTSRPSTTAAVSSVSHPMHSAATRRSSCSSRSRGLEATSAGSWSTPSSARPRSVRSSIHEARACRMSRRTSPAVPPKTTGSTCCMDGVATKPKSNGSARRSAPSASSLNRCRPSHSPPARASSESTRSPRAPERSGIGGGDASESSIKRTRPLFPRAGAAALVPDGRAGTRQSGRARVV